MAIQREYLGDGIYVFTWTGVIMASEAMMGQHDVMHHATENDVSYHYQIIDMSNIQSIEWKVPAWRDVIRANPDIVAITLVRPPGYIAVATRTVLTLLPWIDFYIKDNRDEAIAFAQAYMERLLSAK
ncbi:MAG: hypothetical protein AAF787_08970 [Chloroflexota bacterium]